MQQEATVLPCEVCGGRYLSPPDGYFTGYTWNVAYRKECDCIPISIDRRMVRVPKMVFDLFKLLEDKNEHS